MNADLKGIADSFAAELSAAGDTAALELLRVKYLGKKGLVTEKLKQLSTLSPEERKEFGRAVNELKDTITAGLAERTAALKASELKRTLMAGALDVTVPGKRVPVGHTHPVIQTMDRIVEIFTGMGFGVEEGPEVEADYYNFEALNIPKDHPARDMQDTFYVSDDVVLRTHTSPVQIRAMMRLQPPFRIIAPGKVYRCDADVTHTPMFHQIEGLMVGEDISFANLKGILAEFVHRFYGPDVPVRFRPSFFPFTEPSAEMDIGCVFCGGSGCRTCKGTGWIEIMGAGMVHPRVFEMAGYDPAKVTGFAFGLGIERIAMLNYSIDDLRMMFDNDMRFLRQF